MNWYQVTYDTSEGTRMRLIRANFWMEAVEKARVLSPNADNFVAKEIPTGTRTK